MGDLLQDILLGLETIKSAIKSAILKHTDKSKLKTIFYYAIIVVLLLIATITISKCTYYKKLGSDNIAALTDSIKYYKSKTGTLVAEKTMLEGDMKLLKMTNDSIYNVVRNMGIKTPDNVVYVNTKITDVVHDTCWKINSEIIDSIYYSNKSNFNVNLTRKFDFSDKYRTLYGYTYLKSDTLSSSTILGTTIEKNDVNVDFTVVQKDNKVYITSNNPYITYNNIIAIKQEESVKQKTKHWGVGPYIGFGVTHKFDFVPTLGVSVHYSVFKW